MDNSAYITAGELADELGQYPRHLLVRVRVYEEGESMDHLAEPCTDTMLYKGKLSIYGKNARQVDGEDRDFVTLEFENVEY